MIAPSISASFLIVFPSIWTSCICATSSIPGAHLAVICVHPCVDRINHSGVIDHSNIPKSALVCIWRIFWILRPWPLMIEKTCVVFGWFDPSQMVPVVFMRNEIRNIKAIIAHNHWFCKCSRVSKIPLPSEQKNLYFTSWIHRTSSNLS